MKFLVALLFATVLGAAARQVAPFSIQEDAGRKRKGALVEQGVPVPPMSTAEFEHLAVVDDSGKPISANLEIDGKDPEGRVRWIRVGLAVDLNQWQRRNFALLADVKPPASAKLEVSREGGVITVNGPGYAATFRGLGQMGIRIGGKDVFGGAVQCQIYPDARSVINAGGKTTVLSGFVPQGWSVERTGVARAVVTLRGRYPKQISYSSAPGQIDPRLGYDIELRFHFSALTSVIRYDWRLINQAGYKSWLERYALILPLANSAKIISSEHRPAGILGTWFNLEIAGRNIGVTAPFTDDFGPGTGARIEPGGLAIGGVEAPPDGSLGGVIPEVHRLFYYGMSRTFRGLIVPGEDARSASQLDLKLPAQYYSDLNILPERGDKLTSGEFAAAVERSGRWLLEHQWRGTLWAGEWWREWDIARRQGTEETSNANQELGLLYCYFRTGDRRFLDSAALSTWYVFDVQQDKKQSGFGPMLHTRRHLLDELNWIHPRYQRAAGAILAAHVLLADRERGELIATVRHFSTQIQDADGTPHDWDEAKNARGGETGVDTTNFVEALIAGWTETGDRFFLDGARGYTRWALKKWKTRTDDANWNWNLTRYVETGLLAICHAAKEYPGSVPEEKEFLAGMIEISRHTLSHPAYAFVPGTLGEGGLHYIFYHACLDAQVSRLANDPSMLKSLVVMIRSQVVRQNAEGAFPIEAGSLWSQYPTQILSSYDAESVVACLPVLSARLAATDRN